MFFKGAPLISPSTAPTPVDTLLMRASYVTPNTNNLKQQLLANNVPQSIVFNQVPLQSPSLSLDIATGETTAITDFEGMVSNNISVIRENTGSGSVEWGIFIEVYSAATSSWIPVAGSLRAFTLNSQVTNEKRAIDYTVSVSMLAGQKFRWRHYTNDASRNLSIVSFAAANGLPSSAGAIMSFWGVKP